MTWFSSIHINPQKREGRALLTNRQKMHRAIVQAFPPESIDHADGRVLWRLDSEGYRHTLYVVSPLEPDYTHIVERAGWVSQTWNSIDYDVFLDRLMIGQEWGFRLQANPVKNGFRDAKSRGKIYPHVTVDQQVRWLIARGENLGVEFLPVAGPLGDELSVSVTHREDLRFTRRDPQRDGEKATVTLRKAQFDGALKITDTDKLRTALTHGIGRGKGYGCGLMTLRRILP